jgi:hypothetical protein
MTKSDVINLIESEHECEWLDFKAQQYTKRNYDEFLKDILAFSNARIEGNRNRIIIVGVKVDEGGGKTIHGINTPIDDPASFQQLINSNIEPEVNVEFEVHEIENKPVGVFVIQQCLLQPYVCKKDNISIKKGDIFVRKGTYKEKATKSDFDYYCKQKFGFIDIDKIVLTPIFEYNWLTVWRTGDCTLPSQSKKSELEKALSIQIEREKLGEKNREILMPNFEVYRPKTSRELRQEIKEVPDRYKDADFHYLFEHSPKLNFEILNSNSTWLQDVRIEFSFGEDIYIFPKELFKPKPYEPRISFYPSVVSEKSAVRVFEDTGDIRHHIPSLAFKTPISILLKRDNANEPLACDVKIFAKNIDSVLSFPLMINLPKLG